jgi:hypothetical protein
MLTATNLKLFHAVVIQTDSEKRPVFSGKH